MNKVLLAGLGLALFLVIAVPSASASDDTPENTSGVPEAEACAMTAQDRPKEWAGKTMASIGVTTEAEWLTWVAWWRNNPGKEAPVSQAELDAFARLGVCIAEQLAEPKPNPPTPTPNPDFPIDLPPPPPAPGPTAQPVTTEPTPGNYYHIRYGDTLLGVAGKAYKLPAGNDRLLAARHINDWAYNQRFQRPQPDEPKSLFNGFRISFLPKFGTPAEQYANTTTGGSGQAYAIIFIPE